MPKSVTRNSKGLVDALFDSIDALNAKKIDPEHARAVSHTAKTIVNVAMLELQARKIYGNEEGKSLPIHSLEIEGPEIAHASDTESQA